MNSESASTDVTSVEFGKDHHASAPVTAYRNPPILTTWLSDITRTNTTRLPSGDMSQAEIHEDSLVHCSKLKASALTSPPLLLSDLERGLVRGSPAGTSDGG